MTTRRVLAGSLVLLAVAFWVSTRLLAPVSAGRAVALTDVLAAADRHAISSATLYDVDDRVRVRLRDGSEVTASYPHSSAATAQLVTALARSGAVRVDPQTAKATLLFARDYLLPVLVLAALFGLVLTAGRADGGADGYARFSRVRRGDRVATGGPKNVTFADVAGAQYAVTELAEIVDYLREPARFAALGALPPKGVLLVGPPGTGKTLLARAVAGEADVPFFALSGAEFVESLVGVGAARVRDLFAQVRAKAPAILFIDELDAAGRKRGAGVGGGNDEREQTLNQLLVEMDGFAPASGVVVIAATNRPDILDPALLRPGRFDRMVTVDKPDLAGRREILRLHGAGRPVADDLDLELLARRTAGMTGADLANVWREAALLAVRDRAARIDQGHLDEAVVRVLVGPSRPGDSLSAEERRIVAVHESGHAVVAAALGLASALDRVSIARRGAGLGHTTLLADDRALVRRSDLLDRMAAALGGRAAEEVVLGESTTGAEGDIERATEIAAEMAGRYGMSEGIGPVRIHVKDSEVFLGRDLAELQQVSQETLSRLDVEVRALVEASVDRARTIVTANLATVQSLADALVARDTVSGAALAELLRDVQTSDAAVYPQSSRQPRRARVRRDPA